MSKLMTDIARMLSARRDIALIEEGSRLVGTQIQRVWREFTHNPDSMSPHTRQFWHYYGAAFVVEEPEYMKTSGDETKLMVKRQRDMSTRLGRVGTLVIFPRSLDDVIDILGPEPQDIDEYLARQPHKTMEPTRQPKSYF